MTKKFLIIYEDKSHEWINFVPSIRYATCDHWLYAVSANNWYKYTHYSMGRDAVAECDVPPSIKAMVLLLL